MKFMKNTKFLAQHFTNGYQREKNKENRSGLQADL